MTNEEALKRVKGYLTNCLPADCYEEVEEIIKTLEQEPCEDCISRQAVNEGFKKYDRSSFAYGCVWGYVNKLPSVTPKEKSEYEHDHAVVKAYNDGQTYILDKIRAEIMSLTNGNTPERIWNVDVIKIIDKYGGE